MTTIGVDQGITRALVADPIIMRAQTRLIEAGLGPAVWVCTHVVPGEVGNHVAYALDFDEPASDELLAAVQQAFSPDESSDDGGHAHDHEQAPVPAVWAEGAGIGPEQWQQGARLAVEAQRELVAGRAVIYPGEQLMRGRVLLSSVVELTAIDSVSSMGGSLGDDVELETRDHVRPLRQGGAWVLHVQPARGGVQVPFEAPVHKACCADH